MNRLLTGLVAALIWGSTLILQSYTLLWIFVYGIGVIGLFEYFKICLPQYSVSTRTTIALISSLPLLSVYQSSADYLLPALLFASLIFVVIAFFLPNRGDSPKDLFILKSSTGLLFIGLCASYIPLLITLEDGFYWLGLLTTITIASDTGAYYTGSNFGRHKLCPAISPGKTIEGLVGGLACSVFFALIYRVLFLENQTTLKIVLLTLVITLIGVCGDLAESIIKRSNNTKDSGSILPGHGGILDRIDSILASAPAMFYLIYLGFMY
nr:phosphatidate cytidylyltransferase [Desulfobulbaceae bacterium]